MRCGSRLGGNAVAEAGTEPQDTGIIREGAGPGGDAGNGIGEAGRKLTAPAVADRGRRRAIRLLGKHDEAGTHQLQGASG